MTARNILSLSVRETTLLLVPDYPVFSDPYGGYYVSYGSLLFFDLGGSMRIGRSELWGHGRLGIGGGNSSPFEMRAGLETRACRDLLCVAGGVDVGFSYNASDTTPLIGPRFSTSLGGDHLRFLAGVDLFTYAPGGSTELYTTALGLSFGIDAMFGGPDTKQPAAVPDDDRETAALEEDTWRLTLEAAEAATLGDCATVVALDPQLRGERGYAALENDMPYAQCLAASRPPVPQAEQRNTPQENSERTDCWRQRAELIEQMRRSTDPAQRKILADALPVCDVPAAP